MPGKWQPFTEERKAEFLEVYRRTGQHYLSAEACQVAGTTVFTHLRKDPAFAEAYEEAKQHFGDIIEQEAIRRAVQGWRERPVVNEQGEVVGYVQKFSDSLMAMVLKRWRPEYAEKISVNVSGGVLLVPALPQGSTQSQWELEGGNVPVQIPAEVARPKELKRG